MERSDGTHVAVFHAVRKAIHPEADYTGAQPGNLDRFRRDLFAVPVRFSRTAEGVPIIELTDDPRRERLPN